MVAQGDLIRRREAAKAAKRGKPPEIEEAEVPVATSVVSQAPRSVALPQVNVDHARVLTERDIVMPKLKIAQGLSKAVQNQQVTLGHWYHTTMPTDLGTEVLFVPVDMRKSRSYYVTGQGMLCRSFDMLIGEGTPGILCEGEPEEMYMPEKERGCSLRLWTKNPETGKFQKPKCGINYNYIGVVLMDGKVDGRLSRAILTLRSTASRTAKDINTLVSDLSVNPANPEWAQSVLKLRIEGRSNSFGSYGVPVFEYVEPTPTEGRLAETVAALKEVATPNVYRATLEADPEDDD